MQSVVPAKTLVEGLEKGVEIGNKVGEKIGVQISAPAAPKSKWRMEVRDVFAIIGWLAFIGFSIWYIYDVSTEYELLKDQPTTTISYIAQEKMEFPGMTICNYNAKPPSEQCDHCDLSFIGASTMSVDGRVSTTIAQEKREIETLGLKFYCYIINNDIQNIKTTSRAGYGGSISMRFKITPPPDVGKFGLQVSFHEISDSADIFAETKFASPYMDNMYILNKVTKHYLDGNSTTVWEPSLSQIRIQSTGLAEVIVSVSYGTLDTQVIEEVLSTDIPGLLGSISGIIGLTMGLDIMKMLRGVLEIPYAFHQRSIRGIWKIFN